MATKNIAYNGFMGGYNILQNPYISAQNAINVYIATDDNGKVYIAPTPGLSDSIGLQSTGPTRGQYRYKNFNYVVAGNDVYSLDTGEVLTPIGQLNSSSGFVSITANETQLVFADGQFIYVYDLPTTTFAVVTDSYVPTTPSCITTIDNYVVAINAGTNSFQLSNLGDARVWTNSITSLPDKAFFLSEPDILVACVCFKRKLYLFGQVSTEVWEDAGTADFPLRRINNLLFNHGCAAIESIDTGFERLCYVSADRDGPSSVMINTGSYPSPISTPAVDYKIQNSGDISDSQGYLFRENGQIFYALNSTNGDFSFLLNFGSQVWTTQRMADGTRHIARNHAYFNGHHYVGSYAKPYLFRLSHTTYTNFGEVILREIIGTSFKDALKNRTKIARLEIDMLPGQGTLDGNDAELTVYLAMSKDNGLTFGNDIPTPAGGMSDFDQRTIWRQLGISRNFVPRIRFYNRVPFYILSANVDVEGEPQ